MSLLGHRTYDSLCAQQLLMAGYCAEAPAYLRRLKYTNKSGRLVDDYERLYAMEPRLRLTRFRKCYTECYTDV